MFSKINNPDRCKIIQDHIDTIEGLTIQKIFDSLPIIWKLLEEAKLQPPDMSYILFLRHVQNQFVLARSRNIFDQLRNNAA